MKKKLSLLFGTLFTVCAIVPSVSGCGNNSGIPEHKHRLFDREAVAATCSTDGNIAYQECLYCGDLFVGGKEVTVNEITIPSDPALHVMEHHEANAASCLKDGNIDYYECTVCENTFRDEAGTNPVEETVIYGRHVLKTVDAGEATCYSKEHVQHYVCEVCHQVVKGEENTNENKSSLSAVYSGSMLDHNFVDGVCTNSGCGAKQVKAALNTDIACGNSAEEVTSKAFAAPGTWQALKNESDATVTASESALTVTLASDSSVRLATVPAKEANAAYAGVYELSFDLKVTNYNAADEGKDLGIGFSLRSSAGTGKGNAADYPVSVRKTAEEGVYNIVLFVESVTADQLLQIELANTGAANTDKTVELSNIMFTYYPEAAKTFVNRLEVTLPDTLPEAIAYTVDRINSDAEATTKVPLGQWRYYQANNSRKNGAVASGKGTNSGMSITFSGYFGTKNTERLYYRPNAPVGSKVVITLNLTMSMDGVMALSQPSSASYAMKANETQSVTVSYTVTSSTYVKFDLTINDVKNAKFPDGASCTFDITGVTCDVDFSGPVHTMQAKVDAKAATCTENGNLEYYFCTHCNKYFADENGTNDITGSYLIPATGHSMTFHKAVAEATCTQSAHDAYYSCSKCNNFYSDEEGKNLLDPETLIKAEKLEHSFNAEGVCSSCGATKKAQAIETVENAFGGNSNAAAIKDAVVKNPGKVGVQYNDNNTKVEITEGVLKIEVPNHATSQRGAFTRIIPAKEDGTAFVGAFRISFDFKLTKSGDATSGEATVQLGFAIQSPTNNAVAGEAQSDETQKAFEIGKTYRFTAYVETLNADEFFQFTVRNIAGSGVKDFEISNLSFVYESEAAKTGAYVVERLEFGELVNAPEVVSPEAALPENKDESAE